MPSHRRPVRTAPRRRYVERKRAFRPLFELLEARHLLAATLTVNSTADSNARDTLLTFREALLINNGTLAVGSLSAQEQALVSGSPTSGTNTIAFNFGNSDPNHFYYK